MLVLPQRLQVYVIVSCIMGSIIINYHLLFNHYQFEHRVNNHEEAYKLMCNAMISVKQNTEYIVGHLITFVSIAISLNKIEVAKVHLKLAQTIRENRGWKIPVNLQEMEKQLSKIISDDNSTGELLPTDESELEKICKKHWRESDKNTQQKRLGKVITPKDGSHFTFIKPLDSNEKIYVKISNLPKNYQYEEDVIVEFSTRASFDSVRNRESTQAIDIRLVGV